MKNVVSGRAERTWSALTVEVVILFILNETSARLNQVTAFEAEKGGNLKFAMKASSDEGVGVWTASIFFSCVLNSGGYHCAEALTPFLRQGNDTSLKVRELLALLNISSNIYMIHFYIKANS